MDINFHCSHCKQEITADSSGSGSQVECPTCGATITIPEPDAANIRTHNPIASSAAAKEERHFSVPVHDAPSEVLVQKSARPLEFAAKETDKRMRIKCIRRTDCVEVGHDRFEEVVADFLQKVGEPNVIRLNTINYTHIDMGTRQILTDYGLLIVYRG
jgi:DNA-directed RNA polymerase subunit RPC12/RpoP